MGFLIVNCGVFILFLVFWAVLFLHYRSAKNLLELINHTKIGYLRFKYKDGTIIEINDGMRGILDLGPGKEDLKGRDIREFFIAAEARADAARKAFMRDKKSVNSVYHFNALSGKEKWVLHNSQLVRDLCSGELVVQSLVEDITAEKESSRHVGEMEERYEKLFKHSGDMVVLYDQESGTIEEANPVTWMITGYKDPELIGRSFEGLIHPSFRKTLRDKQGELRIMGVARLEAVIVCNEGVYKEGWMTLSTFEINKKKIVMAVIKDISELVREREEQKKRRHELERFCEAAIEREARIHELREELEKEKKGR